MELFEFTLIVTKSVVIAGTSWQEARKHLMSFSPEHISENLGDVIEISDVQLEEVRAPKSFDLRDEAHLVVPEEEKTDAKSS